MLAKNEAKKKMEQKHHRVSHIKDRRPFMFYPAEEQSSKLHSHQQMDSIKTNWDLFVTLVLVFTAFVTPYRVAYIAEET